MSGEKNDNCECVFRPSRRKKVSYRGLKTKPTDDVAIGYFSQLDYVLCRAGLFNSIVDISTDRGIALNSHHFILVLDLNMEFEKQQQHSKPKVNLSSLSDEGMHGKFTDVFSRYKKEHRMPIADLECHANTVVDAFNTASKVLPSMSAIAKRPWIGAWTVG